MRVPHLHVRTVLTVVAVAALDFAAVRYFISASELLEALGIPVRSFAPASGNPGIGSITVVGLLAFLPQLAIALIAGLVARVPFPTRPTPDLPSTAPAE